MLKYYYEISLREHFATKILFSGDKVPQAIKINLPTVKFPLRFIFSFSFEKEESAIEKY